MVDSVTVPQQYRDFFFCDIVKFDTSLNPCLQLYTQNQKQICGFSFSNVRICFLFLCRKFVCVFCGMARSYSRKTAVAPDAQWDCFVLTNCLARDKYCKRTLKNENTFSKNDGLRKKNTQPWTGWFLMKLQQNQRAPDRPPRNAQHRRTFRWEPWQAEWSTTQESCFEISQQQLESQSPLFFILTLLLLPQYFCIQFTLLSIFCSFCIP